MTVVVGDIGTQIICTITEDRVPVDISTVTEKYIILIDPDRIITTYTASFYTDGSDAKIYYTTPNSNVLNKEGIWGYRGKVIFPNGHVFHSEEGRFEVENI